MAASAFSPTATRAKAIYDERFCRMWEFYLAASERPSAMPGMNNFQIQFAAHQHALPITRNYMQREEDRLRDQDADGRA